MGPKLYLMVFNKLESLILTSFTHPRPSTEPVYGHRVPMSDTLFKIRCHRFNMKKIYLGEKIPIFV